MRDRSVRENRLCELDTPEVSRGYAQMLGPMRERFYGGLARGFKRAAPEARSILDVGTGPGYVLVHLARLYPAAEVHGLDMSEPMLEIARAEAAAAGLSGRIRLHRGSAYALPFGAATLDLVVASNLIHHLDDLTLFLAEVRRVLRPGGALAITDWRRDAAGPLYQLARLHTWWLHHNGSGMDGMRLVMEASWTKPEVEAALAKAGFARYAVRVGLMDLQARAEP